MTFDDNRIEEHSKESTLSLRPVELPAPNELTVARTPYRSLGTMDMNYLQHFSAERFQHFAHQVSSIHLTHT